MKAFHPGTEYYQCPANGCNEAFSRMKQMRSHFEEKHAPKRGFLCAYDGCGRLPEDVDDRIRYDEPCPDYS